MSLTHSKQTWSVLNYYSMPRSVASRIRHLSVCQSACLLVSVCLSAQPCCLSGVVRRASTKGYKSSLAVGALLVHDKCKRSVCMHVHMCMYVCMHEGEEYRAHLVQGRQGKDWLPYLKRQHDYISNYYNYQQLLQHSVSFQLSTMECGNMLDLLSCVISHMTVT